MRKILTTLFLLSFLLCLTACSNSGVKGNGQVASSTRKLAAFQSIDVSGAVNVLVATNKPQKVTLTTDSNLLNDIDTDVIDGTLVIKTRNGVLINPSITPSLTIYVNKLTAIHAAGAVNINVTNLKTDELFVQTEGASNVSLRGEVNDLTITTTGATKIEAVPLQANNVAVNIDGAGKVRIHALIKLKIHINGAGTIEYAGDPEITQRVYGVGRILKIN